MMPSRSIGERIALAALRLLATLVTLTGLAVAVPTITVFVLPEPGDFGRGMAAGFARIGAALLVAGVLALYLGASRLSLFRAEASGPPPVDRGAWRIWFALTLIVLPVVLLVLLRPLVSFWSDVPAALRSFGPWELDAPGGGGWVLLAVIAIFALPGFESLTALGFVAGCALLFALLGARSRVLMRATCVVAILLGGLTAAALLASDGLEALAPAIEREVRQTSPGHPEEGREVLAAIDRYRRVTGGTGRTLGWVWMGLMIWVPVLILRAGGRAGGEAVPAPARGADFGDPA